MQGRCVLVTGAGGFIGSHLVAALLEAGVRVRALVHYNSRNDWGALEAVATDRRLDVRAGDVRDPFLLDSLVEGVEVIFHLAALVAIPYAYVAPAQFIATNVTGTLNVLEAARRRGVARFVHVSTSEVYGSARRVPIDEDHSLLAQSPYAASKIGGEKLAESYWRSFATPVVIVRPFNTYGPRQSARAILPSVISQALTGEVVRVGNLDPVRDMNFVDDTVAGLLAAASAPKVEGVTINLGSGRGISMRDLCDLALRISGRPVRLEVDDARCRPESSEVRELVCDASRAHHLLGWKSQVPLDDGIRRTVDWIGENLERFRPRLYNL